MLPNRNVSGSVPERQQRPPQPSSTPDTQVQARIAGIEQALPRRDSVLGDQLRSLTDNLRSLQSEIAFLR